MSDFGSSSIGGFGAGWLETIKREMQRKIGMKTTIPTTPYVQKIMEKIAPKPIVILPIPPPTKPAIKPVYNHVPIPPEKRAKILPVIPKGEVWGPWRLPPPPPPKKEPVIVPIPEPVAPMPIKIPAPISVPPKKEVVTIPVPVVTKPARVGLFGKVNVPMIVGSVSALLVIGLVFSRMQKRKSPNER